MTNPELVRRLAAAMPQQPAPTQVPNRDSSPILMSGEFFTRLMQASQQRNPELRLLATIGQNRLSVDAQDVITLHTLEQLRVRAHAQGLRKAVAALDTIKGLALSGELASMLRGERTPMVRAAVHEKLRRFGETKYDLNESVILKDSGRRGVIVDYLSDEKCYLIQVGHWETVQAKPGDLMKTAHRRQDQAAARQVKQNRWAQALTAQLSPYNDVVHNTLRSVNYGPQALSATRDKVLGTSLPYPPEFRFIGFTNVHHGSDASVHDADALVIVSFATNLGPRVELRVPVPIREGRIGEPSHFILGGHAYPLDDRGIHIALHGYGLPPRPRHFRPFQAPPAMMQVPDTNVRGMFGPPRNYPRKHPGRPAGGEARMF